MFTFLWLLLLTNVCLLNHPHLAHATTSSQNINIFILAGQSNMSGRGGEVNGTWDCVVPLECGPNPSVLRLSAGLTWVQAQEPLHADIDLNKSCGIGPGMAFANSVSQKDSSLGLIGLVPCAIGGTNISEWAPGSHLYNQLVRRTWAALQGGGTLQAILWYQGESDTVNQEDANLYKGRLEKFFMDLRSDLQSPMLPIIQVALASGGPYLEKVREAQFGIDLLNVRCVDAKGLRLEPDLLHLSTPAQVQLGAMLADAYLQTQPSPIHSSAPKSFHNFVYQFFVGSVIGIFVIMTFDSFLSCYQTWQE